VPLSLRGCFLKEPHALTGDRAEASAKNWSAQIMGAIKETKMVLLDEVRKEEVFTDDGGHFQSSEL